MTILNGNNLIQEFDSKKEMGEALNKSYPVQFPTYVWEIDTGITHWVVANSREECLTFMKTVMEIDDDDLEECKIDNCSMERLCKLKFKDDDGTVRSMWQEFEIQMPLSKMPFELACSEY